MGLIGWGLIMLLANQQNGTKVVILAVVMGLGYTALVMPGYYTEIRELAQAIGLNRHVLANSSGKAK